VNGFSHARRRPARGVRQDQLLKQRRHDPYRDAVRYAEGAVCPECGAQQTQGRWTWAMDVSAAEASDNLCPACQRIHDRYPAGWIYLSGPFLADHKREILRLARNQEAAESGQHPLNRIMAIEESAEGVEITTTDVHLPARIGRALSHAYKGDLKIQYPGGEDIRVYWAR